MKKLTICFIFVLLTISRIFTASTRFFSLSKAHAFNKGERKNVTVTEHGYLRLSGAIKPIHDKNDLIINDLTKGADGNLYIASGNQGKLYKRTNEGKSKVFFKAKGFNIISVTSTNKGVYAAVLPESEIWFIDYNGNAKKIASFKEKYIWQIKANPAGDIFVACGSTAGLYKISSSGVKTLIYKNQSDNHFQALDIYKNKVYFVSEGIGALYEYNSTTNTTKVLYETYEKEITSVAVNSLGEVYFVTGRAKKLILPRNNFDYTDSFLRQSKGTKKFSSRGRYLKNSVYVYNKEKKVTKLFTKDNFIFHSLAIMNNKDIYIGSGTMGIIFKIAKNKRAYYSYKLQENQILCLKKIDKNTIMVGTGNPGKVYSIKSQYAKTGEYKSIVYNTTATSEWGKINVKGDFPVSTSISFYTRTGDTSRPDNTWSKWLKTGNGNKIQSPAARYIQFKLIIRTSNTSVTPIIRRILIPFLKHNRPPQVTRIRFNKGVSRKKTGGKDYNICKLSWSSYDPDHDSLWYKIFIKKRGSNKWKVVLRKTRKIYVIFDSRMFPDGMYNFRIIANDGINNPADLERIGEKISSPVLIDNTNPIVKNIKISNVNGELVLTFTAVDKLSMIGRAQITVNYGQWKAILPADGIFDEKTETFRYIITKKNHKELENGENVIVIKIMDFSGNIISVDTKFIK